MLLQNEIFIEIIIIDYKMHTHRHKRLYFTEFNFKIFLPCTKKRIYDKFLTASCTKKIILVFLKSTKEILKKKLLNNYYLNMIIGKSKKKTRSRKHSECF